MKVRLSRYAHSTPSSRYFIHLGLASSGRRIPAIISMGCRSIMWEAEGRGQKSMISKSNSKHVIASMKNFIENGRQAGPHGQV